MVERGETLVVRRVPPRRRDESGAPRPAAESATRRDRNQLWSATVRGEPAPQTRLHDVVLTDGVARLVKSRPARLWQNRAMTQLLNRRPPRPLVLDLALDCRIWSSAPLPPVDEGLVIEL